MNYNLFFFACALNLFYYVPNLLASPIIGGLEDTSHSFKYHVAIRRGHNPETQELGYHWCGGTLIHDSYVLSVAHCYLTLNGREIEEALNPRSHGIVVLSGSSETNNPRFITQVDQIFIPHEYNRGIPNIADISVLKLSVSLDVDNNRETLKTLPIDREQHSLDLYENKNALIFGNGYDTLVPGNDGVMRPLLTPSSKRQFLGVRITPNRKCPSFNFAICVLNLDPTTIRTSCFGDSGSPLVFRSTVIGVIYRGPPDCNERKLIVCTRTSLHVDFIDNAMNEHGNRSHMYVLAN